jgi:ribosomal protein L11 methyltransferase
MDYIELSCIPAAGQHSADLLVARLAEIGFESFSEEENEILAYIQIQNFTDEVKSLLESAELKEFLSSYKSKIIEDQNWNAVWESAYEPVVIAENCRVRAPFHEKVPGIEFDIVVEPKMSFGTAHHETTRLMMLYLLETELSGKSLLDMGSGTGVLAILAFLKGAGPVTAIDNDEWAYKNALENVNNNIQGAIEVLLGDSALLEGRQFQVVLANINRNILLNDIPSYRKCLPINGLLIMSGFYEEDLPMIRAKANESGLRFISSKVENRWTAASFKVFEPSIS